MTKEPLITVVIPTYNHAAMLRRALQSVFEQSYQNWNAVVINNFSTDNTIEVVNEFKDQRIRCINFSNNGVIAASRNMGIDLAEGSFVAFLDSDDTWFPNKLQMCVSLLNTGADLVCHAEFWIDENGKSRLVKYGPKSQSTRNKLIYNGNRISTSATVVRTSLLKKLNGFDTSPELISTEDYDLWIRIAEISDRIEFIEEPLGEYHRHDTNVSSNIEKHLHAELALLAKHFVNDKSIFYRILQIRRKAIAQYGAGRSFQRTNKYLEALKKYLRSFFIWPFSLRLYAAIGLSFIGLISSKTK